MTEHLGPIPEWIHQVRPGTFDRRILDQHRWWVNEAGTVLAIAIADADATRKIRAVSTDHLHNIVDFLHRRAREGLLHG